MIVEYIRYAIPQGQEQAFLDSYRQAGTELRASKHCLHYEVTRCTEDTSRFIVRIEWDSLEGHLQGFRKEAAFASFFAKVKPFFEQIEEMKHYALTDVVSER